MKTITIEPLTDITAACEAAIRTAKECSDLVEFDFNGIAMNAAPDDIASRLAELYHRRLDNRARQAQYDRHHAFDHLTAERDEAIAKLAAVREQLQRIVVTEGKFIGNIIPSSLISEHVDEETGLRVYSHQYFSPLGDALIALWELAK